MNGSVTAGIRSTPTSSELPQKSSLTHWRNCLKKCSYGMFTMVCRILYLIYRFVAWHHNQRMLFVSVFRQLHSMCLHCSCYSIEYFSEKQRKLGSQLIWKWLNLAKDEAYRCIYVWLSTGIYIVSINKINKINFRHYLLSNLLWRLRFTNTNAFTFFFVLELIHSRTWYVIHGN